MSDHHPPRRENILKEFDQRTIADTLHTAAAIRERLQFCRHQLLLDEQGRPCNEEEATQACTQGVIRVAAREIRPGNRHDARDLTWHTAIAFQHHIGYDIITYDANPETSAAQVSRDLQECARNIEAAASSA